MMMKKNATHKFQGDDLVIIDSEPITKIVAKTCSMPLTTKNLRGHSRHSSMIDGLTNESSVFTDRYDVEAQILNWSVEKLTDDHKQMMFACNKYKKDYAQQHFDYLASNYEGMYLRVGYPDPKQVATYCAKFAQQKKLDLSKVRVLDLGCGTGLVGKYLADQGFQNIYGIDLSPQMLQAASIKGVYTELDEHTLGNPEEFPEKFKLKHDFVTCAGLINNNHMDYLLFEEMLLSCKQGGYVVFSARFSYMGKYWYDDIIQDMTNSMRWKLVASESFFKYDKLDEVSIGRFSRTPCKVFVFQKLQEDIRIHVDKINDKLKSFLMEKQRIQQQMKTALLGKLKNFQEDKSKN